MGIDAAEIVAFLDDNGELGLPDANPWPVYRPEMGELHQVDWSKLLELENEAREPLPLDDHPDPYEEIRSAIGKGVPDPLGDEAAQIAGRRPEACAWYQPIHFHGLEWGIFILEDCMRGIAADIARFLQPGNRSNEADDCLARGSLRMAFASLFLHEAYHHKTEAMAIRFHVVQNRPCYRSYWTNVYEPLTRPGSSGPLEEALANANSFRRLTERAYERLAACSARSASPADRSACSSAIIRATRDYLSWRFPYDPPGYRDATHLLKKAKHDDAQHELRSQVQEGRLDPLRPPSEWRLAPNLNQSLLGLSSDIWLVVPHGGKPSIPTLPLYRPVATDRLQRALEKTFGYQRVKGGKGSHVKLKAHNHPTLTLPGNRKDLTPGVLRSVATSLGFKETGSLLERLGL